jgi:hypothetical protein
MKVVIVTEQDRRTWDEYVMANPAAIAWQSYGWSDVVRKHYDVDFYPLAVFDGPSICGILPLYRMNGTSRKHELISVPYAVAGGLLADRPEAQDLLVEKAIELSKQYGSSRITLKQYKTQMRGDMRIDNNYYNRELSLTADRAELWTRISEQNREKVSDALKSNAVLAYPSTDTGAFYKLLLDHHHRRGIPCVGKRWIEDLLAFQMYSIALLKAGNTVVAGTMVKEFKDTISFPFTCLAGDNGTAVLPVYALYWKLIEHFAEKGKAIFHSGRIPTSDQADAYRLGWGGTKYPYYYQYIPNTGAKTEFAQRRGRKRILFEQGWKRLPRAVAGYLGPFVVKHFP